VCEWWCLRHILKNICKDEGIKWTCFTLNWRRKVMFHENIVTQKLAYVGRVMRGSTGFNALLVLEGNFDGQERRGWPRRTWTDDVIQLHGECGRECMMKLRDWLRTVTLGERWHTCLLTEKKVHEWMKTFITIFVVTAAIVYCANWTGHCCGMYAFSSDEWPAEYRDFDIGGEAPRALRGRGPPCDNVRHRPNSSLRC